MSKKIKLASILTIIIMIILGTSIISSAKDKHWNLKVDDTIDLGRNDYWNKYPNDIFCIQKGQGLSENASTYKVIAVIDIKGTRAEGSDGTVSNDWRNAKLAAILSEEQDKYGLYEGKEDVRNKEDGIVANEIWKFMGTWIENVGAKYHNISESIAYKETASSGYSTPDYLKDEVFQKATNDYKIQKSESSDIKVEAYEKDNKQYMRIGPFKWNFSGKLTDIAVYDQNGKEISKKYYSKFNGNTDQYINVNDISSGKDFYISIPVDSSITKITKIKAKAEIPADGAKIWFLESSEYYLQNLIIREPHSATDVVEDELTYDIPMLGNLKVIKVDQDHQEIKLANVGFYIQNKNTGKYVNKSADGTISYVDNKEKATEFTTDAKGEITINNLVVGTYVAYETKNPNYGYEIVNNGQEKNVVVDKTAELKILNKQKYIKLSGYVWLDKISEKQSYRNDLYKDNDYDLNDILLDGITVRLKDRTTGKTIKEAITANGGAYKFEDVLVDDLEKYYIEFEYDGLTYTNVVPHIDKDNGSKAAENATVRDSFNKDFSVVEGKTENTSITRDSNNNEKYTLSYNLNQNEHIATLNNAGLYKITANTDETKYSIKANFVPGKSEIKNINLGLYEREQPDIALLKDLENVKVSVNGYNHIYTAANRFNNAGTYESGFNVGVKFGIGENEYGNMRYSAPVYKADYEYANEQDKSKELKVYATYRVRIKNESSNLKIKVNSIVDYYDSKYKIIKVGTALDDANNPIENITYTSTNYDGKYSKAIINTNTNNINKQDYTDIYVQFELNREAVINILNEGDNLNNIAEINSYSVFDENGKVYAGIDKDSNPGNTVPGNVTSYQDDTDSAPGLRLEVTNAREMSGKVFLDSTSNELMTGEVRQGSGEYEEGEKGIEGVKVTLTETTGSQKVYETTTDANGDFWISDYIPGDYTLTYTWGDETYTVQNYKATIYKDKDRANNKEWYKTTTPRYSDATDDYNLRQEIDKETKVAKHDTTTTIKQMNSTTPIMGIGVEIDSTITVTEGDEFIPADFKIQNIDFGIVERARQSIALNKRVSTFKATLANGQVISDVTIDEDGKMTGQTKYVTYMEPSSTTMPNNGFVKLELDSELIQGAKLIVGYEIKATNNSEIDYLSENFYKYGIKEGDLVTVTPTAIIDYLDKDWGFNAEENTDWEIKTLDEIKNIIAETVYNNENSTIEEKTILYTETLKEQKLKPTESAKVMLNVSKELENSNEISLDNEVESVIVEKTGGPRIDPTPGNHIPGVEDNESDNDKAETVIVTPSTGDNLNFILPVMLGVSSLVILAAGIVFIKKKIL